MISNLTQGGEPASHARPATDRLLFQLGNGQCLLWLWQVGGTGRCAHADAHRIPVRESESQSGPRAIASRVSATFTWRQQTCDNAFAFDPLLTPPPPFLSRVRLAGHFDQQTKPDARQVRIDWHWLRGYPRAICCCCLHLLPSLFGSSVHTHWHTLIDMYAFRLLISSVGKL